MLTCTNTDCIFDIIHEDLTISEMSGVNLIYDLVNQLRCNFVCHNRLDFDLRKQIHGILCTALVLNNSLLVTIAHAVDDIQTVYFLGIQHAL